MKKVIFLILVVLLLSVINVYSVATTVSYIKAAWNHDPVTVYISIQKGVNSSYIDEVKTVLSGWSNGLKSKAGNYEVFNFNILNKPQSKKHAADISIQVKKNTGNILGSTRILSSGGTLAYTEITIASQNALGKALDRSDFRNILRHEVGHALGLGHSNDNGTGEKDLMYPTYDYLEIGYDVFPSNLNLDALIYLYKTDGFSSPNLSPIPSAYP